MMRSVEIFAGAGGMASRYRQIGNAVHARPAHAMGRPPHGSPVRPERTPGGPEPTMA